jgi:hypothetical protein
MDEDDRKNFQKIKAHFMKAVNEKRLVVDGTTIIYRISRFSETAGERLTISRPRGKDFIAMDGFKDTQQMQKLKSLFHSLREKRISMFPGSTCWTAIFCRIYMDTFFSCLISTVALDGKKQRKLGVPWVVQQLRQICMDYTDGIDPRDITLEEIRFFYMPMIDSLCKLQKALKRG